MTVMPFLPRRGPSWRRERPDPNTETFVAREYETEIVPSAEPNEREVERQLRHAHEQQELEAWYPGRPPR